jgi:hypothetical protein
MKKSHPTPSAIIGFANQGFKIDTIMEDVIMGEVLGLWESNGKHINPFKSTDRETFPPTRIYATCNIGFGCI